MFGQYRNISRMRGPPRRRTGPGRSLLVHDSRASQFVDGAVTLPGQAPPSHSTVSAAAKECMPALNPRDGLPIFCRGHAVRSHLREPLSILQSARHGDGSVGVLASL